MRKYIKHNIKYLSIILVIACINSCSLDEFNPSGFTVETVATSSLDGYRTILNNCYFGWQQRLAGNQYYAMMCEAGTDLWTYQKNDNSYRQFFKYGGGSSMNYNSFKDQWHASYDGIGYCNTAIDLADLVPFNNDEEKNATVAEAHFLRAIYYFTLVEQYGAVTLIAKPGEQVTIRPERTEPLTIYEEVIIPDLKFAAEWLPVTNEISRPSRKSAVGFLAKAYLQTVEYDETKKYAKDALETAKLLINDSESGGAIYGTHLYSTFEDVFDEENNQNNMEALWSHRFIQGGTPRNAWETNEYNNLFYCKVTDFPAREPRYLEYGGISGGRFMPSHYLLKLFVQEDGTLDPRYHKSFQTKWDCNVSYTWTDVDRQTWDRSDAVIASDSVSPLSGDTAVLLIHPNEENYSEIVANKRDKKYLLIDLADIYNDTVRMQYTREVDNVTSSNVFRSFYPSLSKHNSSNVYIARTDKEGYIGNNNALFLMRMAEVYLIAAEADIYENGGQARSYINKIRERAGANPITTDPTIQTVLDERARELCGEFHRYHDLKRTGKLNKEYLSSVNYDVGQFFEDDVHTVRPIPTEFLNTLEDGGEYYQNPGYN